MSDLSIKQVAIVGGTHGNELTGIYAIRKYQKSPHSIQRPTYTTHLLLANPRAVELNRRYVDTDLNRCFKTEDLQNLNLVNNYEQIRAKQIAQSFAQKQIDFIIDLHSTTSQMGITLIINSNHPYLLCLAAHLCAINSFVRILQYRSFKNAPYLRNICPLGVAIEVGSVPQGVLNSELFFQTEIALNQILDYIDNSNQGKLPENNMLTLYRQVGTLDYPRDEDGQVRAMIHPKLLFKDYDPLYSNTPLFLSFDGQEMSLDGQEIVFHEAETSVYHPVFIAEASYVEKNVAMVLTVKKQVDFSVARSFSS